MNTNGIKRTLFKKTKKGSDKEMETGKKNILRSAGIPRKVVWICLLLILSSFSGACKSKNGSGLDLSDIFDLGFFSFGRGSGANPNLQPAYNSVDNDVAQLPVDFGAANPQAMLFINSLDNVDRYKELEIRFSHPMNKTLAQTNFSIVGSKGPLLGPNPGGEFYWMSSQKLRFNSYREFRPAEVYTLTITSAALTISGTALQQYTVQFRTAVDYSMTNTITQGSQYTLNGNNDMSFDQSAPLQLASNFQNPVVANNYIQTINLKKVGSSNSQSVCSAPPCSMSSPVTLNLNTSPVPPTIGGNTYYYEITTTNGKVFQKYFSFNYGRLENADTILPYVANGVMDEAQMLPFLGKAIQKFTTGAFKVLDSGGVPRTFQEFLLGLPDYPKKKFYENGQWTIGEACMKPDGQMSGNANLSAFQNYSYISVFGSKPGSEGRGYCWVRPAECGPSDNGGPNDYGAPYHPNSSWNWNDYNACKAGNTAKCQAITHWNDPAWSYCHYPTDVKQYDGYTSTVFSPYGRPKGNIGTMCDDTVDINNAVSWIACLKTFGDVSAIAPGPFSKYSATLNITNQGISNGNAAVNMDVYVTDMRLPQFVRCGSNNSTYGCSAGVGTQLGNVAADLKVNPGAGSVAPGLGLDLKSRYVEVDLLVVSRFEDWFGSFMGPGAQLIFTTTAKLNWDPAVEGVLNGSGYDWQNVQLSKPRLATARARNVLSVGTDGLITMNVRTPFTINDSYFPNNPSASDIVSNLNNFFILPWSNPNHLSLAGLYPGEDTSDFMWTSPMTYLGGSEQFGAVIAAIVGSQSIQDMAGTTVPLVKQIITQYMLKDIVTRIAPNVLNSVIADLRDTGVTISLPDYLPAPLGGFPLTVKFKLNTDAVIKDDGTNKGLVSSLDFAFTSGYTPAAGLRTQSGKTGMVSTRNWNAGNPPPSGYQFTQSSSNPGFLISMHTDTISQAAYHLWKRRGLDITLNQQFINGMNSFAGSDPLFALTTSFLKASPLVTILVPGRNKLQGLNSSNQLAPPVKSYDDIDMVLSPIHVPNVSFKPMTSSGVPKMRLFFTEMQLQIIAKKPASCTGLFGDDLTDCSADTRPNGTQQALGTVRISFAADADFRFKTFSNPTGNPNLANLNALQVVLDPVNNLNYAVEVLEGATYDPFGLDPEGIKAVISPLVTTLIVPMVNSIMKEIPMPSTITFPKLRNPASTSSPLNLSTACAISATSDKVQFFTLNTPQTGDPYLLGGMKFVGQAVSDPSSLIVCP
ncbi:Ig-like protein [Leptospira fluminis]|uniref:Ig-like protein n=1 Tax=Leptospira fluminis TaxID=2484979 RepID=A0A4R9GQG5_9LEPT|nr:Ig-like domain-containing protein [Leptospira fluminis]TGK19270.1 Ig-like protein [Leptospira fluminis]